MAKERWPKPPRLAAGGGFRAKWIGEDYILIKGPIAIIVELMADEKRSWLSHQAHIVVKKKDKWVVLWASTEAH